MQKIFIFSNMLCQSIYQRYTIFRIFFVNKLYKHTVAAQEVLLGFHYQSDYVFSPTELNVLKGFFQMLYL